MADWLLIHIPVLDVLTTAPLINPSTWVGIISGASIVSENDCFCVAEADKGFVNRTYCPEVDGERSAEYACAEAGIGGETWLKASRIREATFIVATSYIDR